MSKHDELITVATPEGNIKASKGLLNYLCQAFYALHEKNINEGYSVSAEIALEFAHQIHDELKETGYYDDVM